MNHSYQEWRKDWPNEARQPAWMMYGVNSSRCNLSDKKNKTNGCSDYFSCFQENESLFSFQKVAAVSFNEGERHHDLSMNFILIKVNL